MTLQSHQLHPIAKFKIHFIGNIFLLTVALHSHYFFRLVICPISFLASLSKGLYFPVPAMFLPHRETSCMQYLNPTSFQISFKRDNPYIGFCHRVLKKYESEIACISFWWWYIDITIAILDIIRRPVFYLKLNSALQVCPYLTGNTLRLHYEPNRLKLSIGLWRWYIIMTITILDIIDRSVFYLKFNSTL
jgi:hypothetical protein